MQGAVHTYEIMIHERHLDSFGHMNNAQYLELLEEARWDLITQNGYGLKEIQERQAGPTILEVNLRFMREIKNRERIKIESYCEPYTGKICKFHQRMINEQGLKACEAVFVFGLFDLAQRKLIPPTPEWLRAVGLG